MEMFDRVAAQFKYHADFVKEHPWMSTIGILSVALLLAVVPRGAKPLLKFTGLALTIKGAFFLFPHLVFKFFLANGGEGQVDTLHNHEMRCIGVLLMIMGMTVYYLMTQSKDATVQGSLLLTVTLFLILATILNYNALRNYSDKKKGANFDINVLNIGTHIAIPWLVGFLYYTFRQQDWGGYTEVTTSKRNTHLRVDFIIWILFGLLAFVFPKIICEFQVTARMDHIHLYLARLMGIGFMVFGIVAGRASNFLHEADKEMVLLLHGLACVALLLAMTVVQVLTSMFTPWHAFFGMTCVGATGINAMMGCDLSKLSKVCSQKLQCFVPGKKED